jgi:hypothetical protein
MALCKCTFLFDSNKKEKYDGIKWLEDISVEIPDCWNCWSSLQQSAHEISNLLCTLLHILIVPRRQQLRTFVLLLQCWSTAFGFVKVTKNKVTNEYMLCTKPTIRDHSDFFPPIVPSDET